MAAPIDREKTQKINKRTYIICGIIGYLYAVCAFFQYTAIKAEHRRMDFMEAIPQALLNVVIHPLKAFPLHVKGFGNFLLLSLSGICLLIMYMSVRKLKAHDNPETVNGSAHLMNAKELDAYSLRFAAPLKQKGINGKENMILSKDIRLAIDNRGTRRNANILAIGGSGAGKSRFFAGPNILQANCNYVITDPSGELLRDYGKYLEDQGYQVDVFNLTDTTLSSHYNPFAYIREEKDAFTLVTSFIKNTTPEGKGGGDPFWEKSEELLISAIMLYLWHNETPERQTFSNIVRMLTLAQIDEDGDNDISESELGLLFAELEEKDPENLAVQQFKKFKLGAGKTLKSILISVGVRMRAFELSNIKNLTDTDDFDIAHLGDTKRAIFIVTPTAESTFSFLIAMFYSQVFSTLYNYCEINAAHSTRVTNGTDTIKVFHAKDASDAARARKEAQIYIKDYQAGIKVIENKEKKLFEAYSKHTLNKKEKMFLNKEYYFLMKPDKSGKASSEIYSKAKKCYIFENANRAQGYIIDNRLEGEAAVSEKPVKLTEKLISSCYSNNLMEIGIITDDIQFNITVGNKIGWRGNKEDLKKFIESLKDYKADKARIRCEYHIRFIMDEFANIGQIPDFSQKLATVRKYEISCSIILQALSQLKKLYEKEYDDIIGNCDTCVFLGSTDMNTIKYIVEKLGKKTTTVMNTSWNSGGKTGSESFNKSSIELLTVTDIQMMDEDETLVLIRGVRPYYGKKFELTEHPMYNESQKTAGSFYMYKNNVGTNMPYRLRVAMEKLNEAPKEEKVDLRKVEANAQKLSSESAKKALDEFKEQEPSENFLEDLAQVMGVAPNATPTEIKERIETIISLEQLGEEDNISFDMAN